jgi:hypothetical protein
MQSGRKGAKRGELELIALRRSFNGTRKSYVIVCEARKPDTVHSGRAWVGQEDE